MAVGCGCKGKLPWSTKLVDESTLRMCLTEGEGVSVTVGLTAFSWSDSGLKMFSYTALT